MGIAEKLPTAWGNWRELDKTLTTLLANCWRIRTDEYARSSMSTIDFKL